MSESIVRKIQPFTIGTKLSVPSVSKCSDLTENYLSRQTLNNCNLRTNLNDHVSLFLGHGSGHSGNTQLMSQVSSSPLPSSSSTPTSLILPQTLTSVQTQLIRGIHQHPKQTEEDMNQNAVSPTSAASRSIRKITISGSSEGVASPTLATPLVRINPQIENNNNNNNVNTSSFNSPPLPRIVGVSCRNKPSSHLKVLLKKESNEEGQNAAWVARGTYQCLQQSAVVKAFSPKRDSHEEGTPLSEGKDVPSSSRGVILDNNQSFIQRNAHFNKEISLAEAWIKGKLRDLKDGCNVQRSPLKDWEEVSLTLQRDLKDFENTLIQLNQMGEQLMCKANPTSDLVKKQLSQLKDQWHSLKQTAANQSKALGGARNLHEFNRKVEHLEAWIKDKQGEGQSLANLLGENVDKLQLTKRILDLKQDEQSYHNLHEEINHLALKLEKQGRMEGKNIATRRKHVNKMWLKTQNLLKDYHENLQLALEVSSFYQQADSIVEAINNMWRGISAGSLQPCGRDGEIREMASRIMMLDVTVSQLSNLHPSLAVKVTQKQAEMKSCWAVLQKAVREDDDPVTLSRGPQCSVGTPPLPTPPPPPPPLPPQLMGKEGKEEQNRLKGCVIGRDDSSSREQNVIKVNQSDQSAKTGLFPRPPPLGLASRQMSEEQHLPAAPAVPMASAVVAPSSGTGPGSVAGEDHPQLHAQLQKFTVSADKTLSWLKDNVAIATQICSTVSSNSSFEKARRCQAVLEEDILGNRARIELVKKEGRSLVKAQHPGSVRIQEFLGQLEVLWEELKRQHQRNVVVLQASEELNLRAVRVLQALVGLETWLGVVETSIRESTVAGDPESMSVAERESCVLERELSTRGLQLEALRREVDTLRTQRHLHTELLPARIQEVEEKYHSVRSALTQQSSELQDTRMLTEFLERVELENKEGEESYINLGEPLHCEIESEPCLLMLPAEGGGVALLEPVGNPVEELREAVEMLNDTARERGRSMGQDQAIQELLKRHDAVSLRVEQQRRRVVELAQDVQSRESEMAVRCEPETCGLETLQGQQQQLQSEVAELKAEVEAMESLGSRLEELCPERLHVVGGDVKATLKAWRELQEQLEENQTRLQQFGQLREFFRKYLAMISWTEDTRSYIFSESAKHQARNNQVPVAEMLDLQIEHKFQEFDELSAAAKTLIDFEHHLTKMLKERMEELRSMLGWILVHWRAQKAQWKKRKRRSEAVVEQDAIYTEATICSSSPQVSLPQDDPACTSSRDPVHQDCPRTSQECSASPRSAVAEELTGELQGTQESAYEVMTGLGSQKTEGDVSDDGLSSTSSTSTTATTTTATTTTAAATTATADVSGGERANAHVLVLKEPGSPLQRGTVNLILSFNNSGDSQLQVQGSSSVKEEEEVMVETQQMDRVSEPLHRVSTYLHVKDNTASGPMYETMSLSRLSGVGNPSAPPSSHFSSSSFSSSSSKPAPLLLASTSTSDQLLPRRSGISLHRLSSGTTNTTTEPPDTTPSLASSPPTTPSAVSSPSTPISTSIFSSLKRRSKKRRKKRDVRRHTIQKIMDVENQADSQGDAEELPSPPLVAEREAMTYDTFTWPLKERNRKNAGKAPKPENPELTEYMKNPLLRDIDAECSAELRSLRPVSHNSDATHLLPSQGHHVKGHCRFLSLGSVLSFDLPKDVGIIPCIPDVITIAPPVSRPADRRKQVPEGDRTMSLSTFKLARSPPVCRDGPTKSCPQAQAAVALPHQWSEKCRPEGIGANMADHVFPSSPSPVSKDLSRTASQVDLASLQFKRLSGLSALHVEVVDEWDKMAAKLGSQGDHKEQNLIGQIPGKHNQIGFPQPSSLVKSTTCNVAEAPVPCSSPVKSPHACPSVHTLVRDLNQHMYQRSAKSAINPSGKDSPPASATSSHTSHMVLNVKASISGNNSSSGGSSSGSSSRGSGAGSGSGRDDSADSGHFSSGSFKFCSEPPDQETLCGDLPPQVTSCASEPPSEVVSQSTFTSAGVNDPIHPDHQQFEEEEEELEDIWNHTNGYRHSVCSDIMYQGYQEESSDQPPCQQREPSPKEKVVMYRKLITASAPNLFVAEFRLPPSVQSLLGHRQGENPKYLERRDRRSWAAFSHLDLANKQAALALNESASHPVRFPETGEPHKYIYQYKEEDEDEEGDDEEVERWKREEGEKVEGDTSCPKDLLSLHMGLGGPPEEQLNTEDQGYMTITGGRCGAKNGQRPEFPSMEGTLERKHRFLPGGKKAPCRAWGAYHAILYRQTLSFYIDRKDTLRSSASSLPLSLAGADCTPEPEYTKKSHCFSLRLRDGSEYLLSASSRFMMKKWMLRIHANTGSEDAVPSVPMFSSLQDRSLNACPLPSTPGYRQDRYLMSTNDKAPSFRRPWSGHPKEKVLTQEGLHPPVWQLGKSALCQTTFSHLGHREDGFDSQDIPLLSIGSTHGSAQEWLIDSSKRRSHSFTSATYQRIRPVRPPPSGESQDRSSNYSVTLLIGDQQPSSVFNTTGWPRQMATSTGLERPLDLPLRNYTSLPRPRNKSVFKKFFNK